MCPCSHMTNSQSINCIQSCIHGTFSLVCFRKFRNHKYYIKVSQNNNSSLHDFSSVNLKRLFVQRSLKSKNCKNSLWQVSVKMKNIIWSEIQFVYKSENVNLALIITLISDHIACWFIITLFTIIKTIELWKFFVCNLITM